MRRTLEAADAMEGMEPQFEEKDARQHGTLKHGDRKDTKHEARHEGAREGRPERPQPAEGKHLEKRDEEQDKKIEGDNPDDYADAPAAGVQDDANANADTEAVADDKP